MKSPAHAHAYKIQRTRSSSASAIVAVCLLFDDYFKDTLPSSFYPSASAQSAKKKDLEKIVAHRE